MVNSTRNFYEETVDKNEKRKAYLEPTQISTMKHF